MFTKCTSKLNPPAERLLLRGVIPLHRQPCLQQPKAKSELKAEAHAILSYVRFRVPLPSGLIETRLRKMKGIKEVTVNHVSHTFSISYDPSIVTIEKIRTLFRRPVSGF